MARKLEDLVIRLQADTAELRRELRAAEGQVGASAQRMGRSFDGLRSAAVRIGAVVAAAGTGLALLAKRSLDAADNLGKAADRIGVTTESLQRLRFAADLAGVSNAQFDKGLETFVRRLGEAQGGVGSLVTGLKDLDPALLANLGAARNTEEAFLLVADAVSKTEDPAKRAAIGFAAFGRSGVALVNVLAQGRDAIKRSGDELERFGGLLSREAAQAAEDFNDSLLELATFAANSFANSFLGAGDGVRGLTDILRDDQTRQGIADTAKVLGLVAKAVVEITAAVAPAATAISNLQERLQDLSVPERLLEFLRLRTGSFKNQNSASGASLDFRSMADKLGAGSISSFAGEESAGAGGGGGRIGGFSPGSGGGAAASNRAAEEAVRARERAEQRLTDIARAGLEQRLQLTEQDIALVGLRASQELNALEALRKDIPEKEAEIRAAQVEVIENAYREIAKIESEAAEESAQKATEAAKEREERLRESFERVGDFAGDVIGGFLLQQERDWDGFFRSLAASIVSSSIKNLVSQLGSLAAGASAPGGSGGAGAAGLLLSLGRIIGFANGGIVNGPTLGLIGENPRTRPEVVAPLSDLQRMMGDGDGITVNLIGAPSPPNEIRRGSTSDGQRSLDLIWESSAARATSRGFGRQRHAAGTVSG